MGSAPERPFACPADPLLSALSGRWTTHLVYLLGERGPMRFGAVERALSGISPKVLTHRLRALERHGLLWREQAPTIPPQVTYGLTPAGAEVHAALKGLDAPAARWARAKG